MTDRILIVDALGAGSGQRRSSRDSIGCGPRTIAGVFEKNGYPARIVRAEDILRNKSSLRKFNHLLLSAMTMDLLAAQLVVSIWNRYNPQGKIIIGGPIATNAANLFHDLKPDVYVIGEGELTLENLITKGFFNSKIDLNSINGIAFLESDNVIITAKRPHLDSEGFSGFNPSTTRIIDYKAYQACKVYVETVRGCSNYNRTRIQLPDRRECSECGNCESLKADERLECPENIPPGCGFCSVPAIWGPPRSRNPDAIIQEVEELLDLGVHRIVLEAPDFLDYMRGPSPVTNPCSPPANLEAISMLLSSLQALEQFQEGTAHLSIENIKACLFDESAAKTISESLPSCSPNIGLETGSEEHMRAIGKCGTPTDVLKAVRIAKEHKMTPFVYFIYGLPGETPDTVNASMRLMNEVENAGVERIILYAFRSLPGSAFAYFPDAEINNPMSQKMRDTAVQINLKRKHNYVGKTLKGIAAEPSWERHGYTMIYPLAEGPLMTVQGGFSPGTLLKVRVTKVLSEGLLAGEVL
ncbi:MAG: radical SAM protein, partial [Candidatus Thorarchaeota archaeon]